MAQDVGDAALGGHFAFALYNPSFKETNGSRTTLACRAASPHWLDAR